MKTPTLKQVKKYFENAKIVGCSYNNIDECEFEEKKIFKSSSGSSWIRCNGPNVCLWNENKGYAKIIEHKDMNTKQQLQDKINDLQKELDSFKEEPKLEVGKWYKTKEWSNISTGSLVFITKFKKSLASGYGFNLTGWNDSCDNWVGSVFTTPATDKEVEEALIKEAKKRGFKEGVQFKRPWDGAISSISRRMNHAEYYVCYNTLDCGPTIFKDGKWAEIIEEIKPIINGYEMEIKDDGDTIKFGCLEFYVDFVESLYESIAKFPHIKSINVDGNTVTIEQLKEIVDYIK